MDGEQDVGFREKGFFGLPAEPNSVTVIELMWVGRPDEVFGMLLMTLSSP